MHIRHTFPIWKKIMEQPHWIPLPILKIPSQYFPILLATTNSVKSWKNYFWNTNDLPFCNKVQISQTQLLPAMPQQLGEGASGQHAQEKRSQMPDLQNSRNEGTHKDHCIQRSSEKFHFHEWCSVECSRAQAKPDLHPSTTVPPPLWGSFLNTFTSVTETRTASDVGQFRME